MIAALRRRLGIPNHSSLVVDRQVGIVALMATAMASAGSLGCGVLVLSPEGASPHSVVIVALVVAFSMLSLLLLRRGRPTAATRLTFGSLLGGAFALLLGGDGLHDIAILLLPVVLLYGGLLFDKRQFLALVIATVIGLALVTSGELLGFVDSLKRPAETATDFVVALLILSVSALGIAIFARSLYQSLSLAASREQALLEANRSLAEREQDRVRLIGELENRNEELERFTYTVSHDLKSPVVTIRGFLGYIRSDARAGRIDRMDRDLERISEATSKMLALLDDLLELSRIGRLVNPPESVPFAEIAADAVKLVEGRLGERGVNVCIAPNLPAVFGDRARLVEVVQNLVDNAAKFMGQEPEPRIDVSCRVDGGETVFTVRDNGIGIEPRFHSRVFGLFDKLDPEAEGTGIGLALVKRIVEVHGGRIWVESEGLGHGTTFAFTLRRQGNGDADPSPTPSARGGEESSDRPA